MRYFSARTYYIFLVQGRFLTDLKLKQMFLFNSVNFVVT